MILTKNGFIRVTDKKKLEFHPKVSKKFRAPKGPGPGRQLPQAASTTDKSASVVIVDGYP